MSNDGLQDFRAMFENAIGGGETDRTMRNLGWIAESEADHGGRQGADTDPAPVVTRAYDYSQGHGGEPTSVPRTGFDDFKDMMAGSLRPRTDIYGRQLANPSDIHTD